MLPSPLPLRSSFGGGDRNLLSFGGGAGGGIGVSICALILRFLRRRWKNSHAEMAIIKATAAEPIPIPIAWFVLMALCAGDPEPGGPGELDPDRDVGGETDGVAVSEAANVTEAEGETY